MRSQILPTKNVARIMEASDVLTNRASGLPGIGIVHGDTGHGKTNVTIWLLCQVNGVFVTADPCMTPTGLCEAVLHELGVEPTSRSASKLLRQAAGELKRQQRVLFIDEYDFFARKTDMVETSRLLHDLSRQPMIVIGYKGLPKRLANYGMFTSRVLQQVEFAPADLADAKLLAKGLCEVAVQDDLLQHLHELARGNVRELLVGLARIEKAARTNDIESVCLADWNRKDEFFTGSSSRISREAA